MVLKCKYKIKEISNFSTFIKKQIISEVTIMKKKLLMVALAAVMATTSAFAFSGCGKKTDSTPDEAISTVDEATSVEEATILETVPVDKVDAVKDMKLKVDEDGKIVDEKGNEIKPNEKGEVEIATEDGKVVKVSSDEVKAVNSGSNVVVTTAPKNSNSGNTNTNKGNSNSNNSSTGKGNTNNSGSNVVVTTAPKNSNSGNTNTNKGNSNSNNSSTGKGNTNNSGSNGGGSSSTKPADPHDGKTYHEAVTKKVWVEPEYKTVNHPAETKKVNHPAETKQVWVDPVTHEEPVYKWVGYHICNQCGARLDDANQVKWHFLDSDTCVSYKTCKEKIQTGTKTVTDQKGYYKTETVKDAWTETVVVKEAWTEKVLVKEGYYKTEVVREAGWY